MTETLEQSYSIKRIQVKKLFGRYDYCLPDMTKECEVFEPLLILYGDNGTGKTTILKMVYHLLNGETKNGHRSFLSQTPFESFEVDLLDGTTISAARSAENSIGSFTLAIQKDGIIQASVFLQADADGAIRGQGEREKQYHQLLAQIQGLKLSLYLLTDDRRLSGENVTENGDRFESHEILEIVDGLRRIRKVEHRETDLDSAMHRAEAWIRDQCYRGTSIGAVNAHSIYADIISQLVAKQGETQFSTALEESLTAITNRTRQYEKFGLASRLDTADMLSKIKAAPPERQTVISHILQPYIEGTMARLDAVQEIQTIIQNFVETVNSFLSDKFVSFTLRDGFVIHAGDKVLESANLSSGERQLLLLLCNTLAARSHGSIFIIDEPELSLNVKWQRKLVNALLNCIRGSRVQFILATHSIELLTRHRDHVVRLENAANAAS